MTEKKDKPMIHCPIDNAIDYKNPDTWPMWLSAPEICIVLRLSMSTVRQLLQSRKLRSRRFGKQLRVHKADMLAFTN
jgi:excisionase family DNA binding protein